MTFTISMGFNWTRFLTSTHSHTVMWNVLFGSEMVWKDFVCVWIFHWITFKRVTSNGSLEYSRWVNQDGRNRCLIYGFYWWIQELTSCGLCIRQITIELNQNLAYKMLFNQSSVGRSLLWKTVFIAIHFPTHSLAV